jgi:hypothetical protein
MKWVIAIVLAVGVATGCGETPTAPSRTVKFDFDFATRPPGWIGGSSDYSPAVEPIIDFAADYRTLPAPLNEGQVAAYIAGNNNSEDLFLFYKTRVNGLAANESYAAKFSVEIATNIPHGCFGIGGSPGEDSTVKAGASPREPERVLQGDYYVMNIDKGNQSTSGVDAVAIGHMANSVPCQPAPGGGLLRRWELKALASGADAVRARAAPDGSIWLLLGVDEAAVGRWELYVTKLSATFQRVQ